MEIDASLCVDLAGVRVAVECEAAVMAEWLKDRFAGFWTGGAPEWRVTVEVTGPTPSILVSPREVRFEPLTIRANGGHVSASAETFTAVLDLDRRRAAVRGPLATYPLNSLLNLALPLLTDDLLVLHGAMLADRDRGYVCCGPSGSGKSTLARMLPDRARCDELLAVRRRAGGFTVHALPFWQARPAAATLERVYLLDHGEEHCSVPLGRGEAFRSLSRQVLWPVTAAGANGALGRLADLVAEVEVSTLRFAPAPDVWAVIAAGA